MLRATAFALAMFGAISTSAHANGLQATQIVEVASITLDADGNETRTYSLAEEIAPGDEVRYSLSYVNEADRAAEAVSLVMPVPSELTYIEGSVGGTPSQVSYSADNGATFAERDALVIGQDETARLASAEEITHIKWVFVEPIPVAASGTISFSATLK